jgi:hypothetical protein
MLELRTVRLVDTASIDPGMSYSISCRLLHTKPNLFVSKFPLASAIHEVMKSNFFVTPRMRKYSVWRYRIFVQKIFGKANLAIIVIGEKSHCSVLYDQASKSSFHKAFPTQEKVV